MAQIESPDENEKTGTDLQAELRDSGATKIAEHIYRTNQGTVMLMSPQDEQRGRLIKGMRGRIDRRRRWSEPDYIPDGQVAMKGKPPK